MLTRIQKGNNIYAVYELDNPYIQIDKISFMMINSNQSHGIGLASISFEEMNGVYYKMLFDVTGKITLREYIGKHISQEDFRQMLLNLINTIEQFDEYMIDVNQILLDMDCVYINSIDHSVSFLCIALKGIVQTYRPYEFFRAVVQNSYVNLNINEVSYFNHIWNITSNENGFSLSNMKAAMNASQESVKKFESSKAPALSKNTPETEQKIEEPETITVSQPKTPIKEQSPIVSEPEQEEQKGGFLSRFLPTSKKKKTASGYQGGLAGLKSGLGKTPNPVETESEENKIEYQPQMSPPFHHAEVQQPVQQGTTVLKGKPADYFPEISAEEAFPSPGTTVLKGKNPDIPPQSSEFISPGTTVLNQHAYAPASGTAGTTVLKQSHPAGISGSAILQPPVKTACLIRIKNHERIFINKPVVLLGRDSEDLDCNISDNTNVSHHHARIIQRNNEYFIVDLGSFNYTYLNNKMLPRDMELRLSDGDKIRLADEEFEFRIA